MKNKLMLILTGVLLTFCLTGCVKVIDKGTEGQYTGEHAFDAASDSGSDWDKVTAEISGQAKELSEVTETLQPGQLAAVQLTAKVAEYESKANGKKNGLILEAEGIDKNVQIQIGPIYSGTDIRDAQTVKTFEAFTNQTEWSQYGKALNAEVDTRVVGPLAIDETVVGKTVTVIGVASVSGDTVTITPVSLTLE